MIQSEFNRWTPPGFLHRYQSRGWRDRKRLRAIMKSRRIGETWSEAGRAVRNAIRPGGQSTFYFSHTYDSGLLTMKDVEWWADRFDAKSLKRTGKSIWLGGNKDAALSKEAARFASGAVFQIMAAKGRKARGVPGTPDYVLDEFALHLEPEAMLEAARAILMRGRGNVTVMSTVMYENDPFYEFCEECRLEVERLGDASDKSFDKITFDDALADGFYEREAWMMVQAVKAGLEPPSALLTVDDKALAAYLETLLGPELLDGRSLHQPGSRVAYREKVWRLVAEPDRELLCIPSRSGSAYMSKELIERTFDDSCKVFRWEAPRDFLEWPYDMQERTIREWIDGPGRVLEALRQNPKRHWFYGVDFGRSRDLTVISVGYMDGYNVLRCPWMLELDNVPFHAQNMFFDEVMKRLDLVIRGALDRGVAGAQLAEHARITMGPSRAEGVQFSREWYLEHMPGFRRRFEDLKIAIPRDEFILSDLRAIKLVNGVPMIPRGERVKVGGSMDGKSAKYRHGDAAISLLLLDYAARDAVAPANSAPGRFSKVPTHRKRAAMRF